MDLSQRTGQMMRARGFNVDILELNEIADISDLEQMEHVILMASTAGEGDMPQTADSFWEFINDPSIETDTKPLKNMKLSSFGLGDTSYRYFNKSVLDLEKRLVELGATPVIDTGMGNDQDDDKYETAFEEWLPAFWKEYNAEEEPDADLIPSPLFELEPAAEAWSYVPVRAPSTKVGVFLISRRWRGRGCYVVGHGKSSTKVGGGGMVVRAGSLYEGTTTALYSFRVRLLLRVVLLPAL